MDTITFDGKEYTKGAVLAERFKYTADYLGQLCRGKKVDARLVGRAWYVNLDSLLEHRSNRYKSTEASEIYPKKAIHNYLSRVDVEPILKNKTVRILKGKDGVFSEVAVKYEVDEQALIPKVHKTAVSVNLPIRPAEAEVLRVRDKGLTLNNFRPEPRPDFALSGTLVVSGIPEAIEEASEPDETPDALASDVTVAIDSKPLESKKTVIVRLAKKKSPVALVEPTHAVSTATRPQPMSDMKNPSAVSPVASPINFTPALVAKSVSRPVSSSASFLIPVTSLFLALLCSAFIASTNLEILASRTSYNDRLIVQTANLAHFSKQLGW